MQDAIARETTDRDFDQAMADRLEAAMLAGATADVTIDGVRFTAHCPVGLFVLVDEIARLPGRRWSVAVRA